MRISNKKNPKIIVYDSKIILNIYENSIILLKLQSIKYLK